MYIDKKATLGQVMLDAIRQQTITWPIFQVHDAIWRLYASNEFSLYLTVSALYLLIAYYFQYFGHQQAWY